MESGGGQRTVFWQIGRFAVSGVAATLVDLAVLNALMWAAPGAVRQETYVLFKSASFAVAATFSYFANKHFTFRKGGRPRASEAGRFALVATIGFAVNVLLPIAFFGILSGGGLLAPALRANVASLMGTAVSLVVNFVGYKRFVFKA